MSAAPPAPAPSTVYRTDAAGTRQLDPLAASFAAAGQVELHAFGAWAKAFGKTGAVYDSRRAACLAERVGAGMTSRDADDAIAGALRDPYVNGKKDGRKNDRLTFIFGDAERFEEFRDAGKKQRERSPRKVSAAAREAEYQEQLRREAAAHHAALTAGSNGAGPPNLAGMVEAIGGG